MFLSEKDEKKNALKLHKQFGHPTSARLIGLIRKAGISSKSLELEIVKTSEACVVSAKLKKAPNRPVVCMPMAQRFNETVAMDLKYWNKNYFLVLVDMATRFCTAVLITSKNASVIVKNLFKSWICIFGNPEKFLSDNGLEFNSEELRELGEKYNIKIMTTSAEAAWSNGMVEKLNGVLADIVRKVMTDTGSDVETALAWAVAARNALDNNMGFSPNQMVFGRNPALPNVFNSALPALEPVESSDVVRKNLNAMYVARQEFMKAEACERIKRALKHKVRDTPLADLKNGDEVYYKRNDSHLWHGPAIVIGRDGKQILVRHGGQLYRVHACRLTKCPQSQQQVNEEPKSKAGTPEGPDVSQAAEQEDNEHGLTDLNISIDEHTEQAANNTAPGSEDVEESANMEVDVNDENEHDHETQEVIDPPERVEEVPVAATVRAPLEKLKIGVRVEGRQTETGDMISGELVSRAGKRTGKFKNCYNIEKDDGSVEWFDFDRDFESWRIVPNEEEMLVCFASDKVKEAKDKELQNWNDNDVYVEVDDIGQESISVRWVITEKIVKDEKVIKARLVARGFEEDSLRLTKDSPTCSKECLRIALAIASSKGWKIHSTDIRAAFLQGNSIDRDLFLKPPPEYYKGKLWKLKKTVYGLCDAARAWYERVKDVLLSMGMQMCKYDPALFYWKPHGETEGIICVHVDDFLSAGTENFESTIMAQLNEIFCIGNTNTSSFKYLGKQIRQNDRGICLNQAHYISTIKPISLSRQRASQTTSELSDKEKQEFRCALGQLNWIATSSRPDIAFEVCQLCVIFSRATIGDILVLNKLIRKVNAVDLTLYFPQMLDLEKCTLECYTDASFANLADCGSQGGYIIFLRDERGRKSPITWQSRKIRRVVKSTLAAETLALVEGAEVCIYIQRIIAEMMNTELNINCSVDNKSLVDALHSTKSIDDRRLRIDISILKEMLAKHEISQVSWIDCHSQLANCLTKNGANCAKLISSISLN